MDKKLTLKQAQEQNKLEEFIQQQEDLEAGDEELFDNTLKSMLENKSVKAKEDKDNQNLWAGRLNSFKFRLAYFLFGFSIKLDSWNKNLTIMKASPRISTGIPVNNKVSMFESMDTQPQQTPKITTM